MKTWDYIVDFTTLRIKNCIATLEIKSLICLEGEIFESDSMWIKDPVYGRYVQVIFFKDRFINVTDKDRLPKSNCIRRSDLTCHIIEHLINN